MVCAVCVSQFLFVWNGHFQSGNMLLTAYPKPIARWNCTCHTIPIASTRNPCKRENPAFKVPFELSECNPGMFYWQHSPEYWRRWSKLMTWDRCTIACLPLKRPITTYQLRRLTGASKKDMTGYFVCWKIITQPNSYNFPMNRNIGLEICVVNSLGHVLHSSEVISYYSDIIWI